MSSFSQGREEFSCSLLRERGRLRGNIHQGRERFCGSFCDGRLSSTFQNRVFVSSFSQGREEFSRSLLWERGRLGGNIHQWRERFCGSFCDGRLSSTFQNRVFVSSFSQGRGEFSRSLLWERRRLRGSIHQGRKRFCIHQGRKRLCSCFCDGRLSSTFQNRVFVSSFSQGREEFSRSLLWERGRLRGSIHQGRKRFCSCFCDGRLSSTFQNRVFVSSFSQGREEFSRSLLWERGRLEGNIHQWRERFCSSFCDGRLSSTFQNRVFVSSFSQGREEFSRSLLWERGRLEGNIHQWRDRFCSSFCDGRLSSTFQNRIFVSSFSQGREEFSRSLLWERGRLRGSIHQGRERFCSSFCDGRPSSTFQNRVFVSSFSQGREEFSRSLLWERGRLGDNIHQGWERFCSSFCDGRLSSTFQNRIFVSSFSQGREEFSRSLLWERGRLRGSIHQGRERFCSSFCDGRPSSTFQNRVFVSSFSQGREEFSRSLLWERGRLGDNIHQGWERFCSSFCDGRLSSTFQNRIFVSSLSQGREEFSRSLLWERGRLGDNIHQGWERFCGSFRL